MNTTEADRLEQFGVKVEHHFAVTEDGYILHMHRLKGREGKPVIFFQHGLVCSSWAWVVSNDYAPAIRFWKLGYDVWLGNFRGNMYSQKHTTLQLNSTLFWDFTFEQMGECDLPAELNYVREHTKQEKVTYVGWSEGTAAVFVNQGGDKQFAKCKKYPLEEQINLFIALSPIGHIEHNNSRVLKLMSKWWIAGTLATLFPFGILFFTSMAPLEDWVCYLTGGLLCHLTVNIIAGKSNLDDTTNLVNFVAHFPSGTSVKNLNHFAQIMQKGFRRYDYGLDNLRYYHSREPPSFDLSAIRFPTALFFADKDLFVQPKDRQRMEDDLRKSNQVVFSKLYEDFSHVTWNLGNSLQSGVYLEDMEKLLRQYNPVPIFSDILAPVSQPPLVFPFGSDTKQVVSDDSDDEQEVSKSGSSGVQKKLVLNETVLVI